MFVLYDRKLMPGFTHWFEYDWERGLHSLYSGWHIFYTTDCVWIVPGTYPDD